MYALTCAHTLTCYELHARSVFLFTAHLDKAYGGYCVFATVAPGDTASWATINAIAAAVPRGENPVITKAEVQ